MSAVTEKAAEKGMEFLETAITLAKSEVPKLTSQYLDYMIFTQVVSFIQNLMWAALLFIAVRTLNGFLKVHTDSVAETQKDIDTWYKNNEDKLATKFNIPQSVYDKHHENSKRKETIESLKVFRGFVVVGGTIALVMMGLPEIKKIGKIVIAPEVFLLQEGAKMLKDIKK
jgi:hypothetical protein